MTLQGACLLNDAVFCDHWVDSEHVSPGGTQKAVVFFRSCGVMTNETVEIAVVPASAHPPKLGNTFRGEVRGARDDELPGVSVMWRTDTELAIETKPFLRVHKARPEVGRVAVTYRSP